MTSMHTEPIRLRVCFQTRLKLKTRWNGTPSGIGTHPMLRFPCEDSALPSDIWEHFQDFDDEVPRHQSGWLEAERGHSGGTFWRRGWRIPCGGFRQLKWGTYESRCPVIALTLPVVVLKDDGNMNFAVIEGRRNSCSSAAS